MAGLAAHPCGIVEMAGLMLVVLSATGVESPLGFSGPSKWVVSQLVLLESAVFGPEDSIIL